MTDTWTWADVQAELHMSRLAEINRFRWIMGEPPIDAWELADVRSHVEAINTQVREMIAEGRTINI